jgi:nucleotide-binding universal stress UspA family protein
MFEKILYPTDFSDVATKALNYIKKLKDSGAKEVVALHVIDERGIEPIRRLLDQEDFESMKIKRKKEAEQLLKEVTKELSQAGLKVKLRIETGIPFREILRVEAEENVSAVVLGSHGVSNLQEIFLGSVSEKVIRKSRMPIFVIKR